MVFLITSIEGIGVRVGGYVQFVQNWFLGNLVEGCGTDSGRSARRLQKCLAHLSLSSAWSLIRVDPSAESRGQHPDLDGPYTNLIAWTICSELWGSAYRWCMGFQGGLAILARGTCRALWSSPPAFGPHLALSFHLRLQGRYFNATAATSRKPPRLGAKPGGVSRRV